MVRGWFSIPMSLGRFWAFLTTYLWCFYWCSKDAKESLLFLTFCSAGSFWYPFDPGVPFRALDGKKGVCWFWSGKSRWGVTGFWMYWSRMRFFLKLLPDPIASWGEGGSPLCCQPRSLALLWASFWIDEDLLFLFRLSWILAKSIDFLACFKFPFIFWPPSLTLEERSS